MKKNKLLRAAAVLFAATCISASVFSGTLAKYVKSVNVGSGWTLTATAKLAESVKITENKVEKQPDGTYELTDEVISDTDTVDPDDPDEKAPGNEYTVMPGVDLPKNPKIVIENLTDKEIRIFVEVVETNKPDGVTYELTDIWSELRNVTGPNGGKVYVCNYYVGEDIYVGESTDGEIQILKNNKIYVSDSVSVSSVSGFQLDFYGYISQYYGNKSDEKIFKEQFSSNT